MGICLVLSGSQGIGKGFLTQILKHCLGELMFIGHCEDPSKQFNSSYAGKTVVFLDEFRFFDTDAYNSLKTLISEPHLNSEKKFQEQKTYENFAHVILAMNPEHVFESQGQGLDLQDRRFFLSSCVNILSDETKELTRETVREMSSSSDKTEMKAFFFQLMNINVFGFDYANFPITKKGRINRKNSKSTWVLLWFKTRLVARTLLPAATYDFISRQSLQGSGSSESSRESVDPSFWNPLNLQSTRLYDWRNFFLKESNKYINSSEWKSIQDFLEKGGKKGSIDILSAKTNELSVYWTKPFWLQVVPLSKLYNYCKAWIQSNFPKATLSEAEFQAQLSFCVPGFTIEDVQVESSLPNGSQKVTEIVKMIFFPSFLECQKHFEAVSHDLIDKEDSHWVCKTQWEELKTTIPYYVDTEFPELERQKLEMNEGKDKYFNEWGKMITERISDYQHDPFLFWAGELADQRPSSSSKKTKRRVEILEKHSHDPNFINYFNEKRKKWKETKAELESERELRMKYEADFLMQQQFGVKMQKLVEKQQEDNVAKDQKIEELQNRVAELEKGPDLESATEEIIIDFNTALEQAMTDDL
jgi:hypothetical protein